MATTFEMTKQELIEKSVETMKTNFSDLNWSVREKLALTSRILFDGGHDSGLAGQITSRAEKPDTYYTQRLGLGFDEITAENLLVVDHDLNVSEGSGIPNPANRFHSWIYRVRPDVNCIIHTHPIHVAALSMLEIPLEISHMDNCNLFEDCAFLEKWPGVPVGNDEGDIISKALGDKRAVLLSHHGMLVAGTTIEEACVLALQFERTARMQLLAMSAGSIKQIDAALGREAHDWLLKPKRSQVTFAYYARKALRGHPDCI
ncbi:aldolase [Cereibacter sp. SYSU M97828]|nr:aldolase [Cereibacter flavus]